MPFSSNDPAGLYFYRADLAGNPLKVYLLDAAWASGETMAATATLQSGPISDVKRIGNFPFGPLQATEFGPVSFKPGAAHFLPQQGGTDPLDPAYSDPTIKNALRETLYGPGDMPVYPPGTFYMQQGHILRAWVFQESGFIQAKGNDNFPGDTTVAVTLDADVTAGHFLVVAFKTPFDRTPTFADSQANVYTQVGATGTTGFPGVAVQMWYAFAGASGPLTVTVTDAGGPAVEAVAVLEYTGADPGSPFDATSSNHIDFVFHDSTRTTGSLTAGANAYLLVGAFGDDADWSEGAGYTAAGFNIRVQVGLGTVAWFMVVDRFNLTAGASYAVTADSTRPTSAVLCSASIAATFNHP